MQKANLEPKIFNSPFKGLGGMTYSPLLGDVEYLLQW